MVSGQQTILVGVFHAPKLLTQFYSIEVKFKSQNGIASGDLFNKFDRGSG